MAVLVEELIRTACAAALEEVLETMFFEVPGEAAAPLSPPGDALVGCAVFSGSLRGEFAVALAPETLERLSVGFLGLDESKPPGEDECEHVLFELANMLCGASMSRLEPDGRLRIEPPRLASEAPGGDGWIVWPLDGGAIWVRLRVDGAQGGERG